MKHLTTCLFALTLFIISPLGITETPQTPANPYVTKYSRAIELTEKLHPKTKFYLSFNNKSNDAEFYLQQSLEDKLKQQGYQITTHPTAANIWLKINIISVGPMSQEQIDEMNMSDYGYSRAGKPKQAKDLQVVAIIDVQVDENNQPSTDSDDLTTDSLAVDTADVARYFTRIMTIAPKTDQPIEQLNDPLVDNLSNGVLFLLEGKG